MTTSELDAAGIADPRLRAAYDRCRRLNAEHGRTYFLATRMLTAPQRPAIHALYGFARYADDIVDLPPAEATTTDIEAALRVVTDDLFAGLRAGHSPDPILAAVIDTAHRYTITDDLFDDFLASMRMDLFTTHYPDRAALETYTRGSAEVIGLQVLPVLGTVTSRAEAAPAAAALGLAFQLTNFLRDVAEDYERGRVYLPADELGAYDVDTELLGWCVTHRRTEPRVTKALAEQIAITRRIYREAEKGIAMLAPVSRPCVRTAYVLYSEILKRIEAADYDVFSRRARVGTPRKATVAAKAYAQAVWARRSKLRWPAASGQGRVPDGRTT
ncbi:phytoene/squalene synthase family protein [Kribbella sp. CA-293567]|uniref:phytoene/squalene synthase family protein n=1 Tax=Kribbella sp. CA-293567 TaxID=3002436 RepID=UPI0022DE47B7|nr:phytoene/squalene synthase family protein [Kribbella sp. CA-293567]WBQ08329.1 phytoene/squalene synthase family protein [Kribbella sp. CA-293567]